MVYIELNVGFSLLFTNYFDVVPYLINVVFPLVVLTISACFTSNYATVSNAFFRGTYTLTL